METQNARIESTHLGYEDHGILTALITLSFYGSGQGFGGYGLDAYDGTTGKRKPRIACGLFVGRVLDVLKIDRWEKLPGTPCRVRIDRGKIEAIGHFLKDDWFAPASELKGLD